MLESIHRSGHGRIASWDPSEGLNAVTPELVLPDVPQLEGQRAQIWVTKEPKGRGIELTSLGTWFHPTESSSPLAIAAPQPGPTSLTQVLSVGDDLAIFHDAGGWASDPSRLIPAWIDAKHKAGHRLFWAPALGTPANYALWVYLGADLFDASTLLLHAVRGEATTVDGILSAAEMEQLHGGTWDTARLTQFNLDQARQELRLVHKALADGKLRALVERRIYTHPSSVELLRRFDREHEFLEQESPRTKAGDIACMTYESIWMPEVVAFRRRMREQYIPPETDVLLLLPCSARKPYRLSPSHRKFSRALDDSGIRHRVHEVMVTSPLGLVPREMENIFPAQHYDVPVTGEWNRDEAHIIRQQLESLLKAGSYKQVIAHIGGGTWNIIKDLVPDAVHTVQIGATNYNDLGRLRAALAEIDGPRGDPRQGGRFRKIGDLRAMLSYQFNAAIAHDLTEGGKATGKAPYVKLLGPEGQRGQTTPERGFLSLTMAGAKLVAPHGFRVQIADFKPKKTASLFAVGVDGADPDIRYGDEVAVMHGDELRACGVAHMSAGEMTNAKRGVAVQLRHAGES